MLKYLVIVLWIFSGVDADAQLTGQPLIDSLSAALPHMKQDSNKAKALSKISRTYYTVSVARAIVYGTQALELAEQLHWKRGIANLNNDLGLFLSDTGNNVLARKYFQKSYELNLALGSKMNQINNLNNIGRGYLFESDFLHGSEFLFRALKLAEEIQSDEHIALAANNLVNVFLLQQDFPRAAEYAQLTLEHATKAGHIRYMTSALRQLGSIKLKQKDSSAAMAFQQKALKISRDNHYPFDIARGLADVGELKLPHYEEAVAVMLQADSIFNMVNPSCEEAMVNAFNLAESYHALLRSQPDKKDRYQQPLQFYYDKAARLAKQNNSAEVLSHVLMLQSAMASEHGDYKTAYESYKKSKSITDSLYSQEKKNVIAGMQSTRDLAQKNNEIALGKLTVANQRKTQWGLLAGLVLLLAIGVLLFRQSQSRKKINTTLMVLNNQLDEANKVKARFFGILSHDLRSPIVNLVHFLQLQRDEPQLLTPEQQDSHRQTISESAESLLNTMEAMLLWSKEQMENFKPNMKNVAVEDLFNYLKNLNSSMEPVALSFDYSPGMTLVADENYLRTIMQNLTFNAVRALKDTPGGSVQWKAFRRGEQTILSITDNGPGIAAEQAKTLFEEGIAQNGKHGFGLHIVRDLARAISYKISVESEQGRGTTFTLSSLAA